MYIFERVDVLVRNKRNVCVHLHSSNTPMNEGKVVDIDGAAAGRNGSSTDDDASAKLFTEINRHNIAVVATTFMAIL